MSIHVCCAQSSDIAPGDVGDTLQSQVNHSC